MIAMMQINNFPIMTFQNVDVFAFFYIPNSQGRIKGTGG